MTRVRRVRLALLGIAVVIIAAVMMLALRERRKQIVIKTETSAGTAAAPAVAVQEVAYSTTNKDNFREWDLQARSAHYFQNEKKVLMEEVTVKVYRPDGTAYQLRGKSGQYHTETKNIEMHGAIRGCMPDNTTIATESFYYDHAKRIISTNDKIMMRRGGLLLEGVGMIIDLNTEKLTLLGNVKAVGSK